MIQFFNQLVYRDGIYFSENLSSVNYPNQANRIFNEIEDNSFWYQHRNNCILEVIRQIQPKGKIVEIGGGNAFVSKGIQDAGYKVIVVEPDINGILNAKFRGISELVCSSFADLKFSDEKIENIGLFDVLEHIENDNEFLCKIHNQLSIDGFFFITIPTNKYIYSVEDEHDGHYRRYTISEIKNKLINNGFEVVYSSYFFSYLLFPIFLFRTLPSLLKIGKFSSIIKYKMSQKKEAYQSEHEIKNSVSKWLISFLNRFELKQIKLRRSLAFGSSCLIVARINND